MRLRKISLGLIIRLFDSENQVVCDGFGGIQHSFVLSCELEMQVLGGLRRQKDAWGCLKNLFMFEGLYFLVHTEWGVPLP